MKPVYFYAVAVFPALLACSCQKATTATHDTPLTAKKAPRTLIATVRLPEHLDTRGIKTSAASAEMRYMETLDEVKQRADAIVVGYPTQDFASRAHRVRYLPQDDGDPAKYVDSAWTQGPFHVDRVLYQKAGRSLTSGQTISLAEPVGLSYDANTGAVRSIIEDCTELKQRSKYVLFLLAGNDGSYIFINFNLGRFNTDGTDREDELGMTNGTCLDGSKTAKQNLRDQLAAKYGVKFRRFHVHANARK